MEWLVLLLAAWACGALVSGHAIYHDVYRGRGVEWWPLAAFALAWPFHLLADLASVLFEERRDDG